MLNAIIRPGLVLIRVKRCGESFFLYVVRQYSIFTMLAKVFLMLPYCNSALDTRITLTKTEIQVKVVYSYREKITAQTMKYGEKWENVQLNGKTNEISTMLIYFILRRLLENIVAHAHASIKGWMVARVLHFK